VKQKHAGNQNDAERRNTGGTVMNFDRFIRIDDGTSLRRVGHELQHGAVDAAALVGGGGLPVLLPPLRCLPYHP
jgi:hypothetical protein